MVSKETINILVNSYLFILCQLDETARSNHDIVELFKHNKELAIPIIKDRYKIKTDKEVNTIIQDSNKYLSNIRIDMIKRLRTKEEDELIHLDIDEFISKYYTKEEKKND